MSLVVRAGSVLEEEQERGVAHILEHLAFNATEVHCAWGRLLLHRHLSAERQRLTAACGSCRTSRITSWWPSWRA